MTLKRKLPIKTSKKKFKLKQKFFKDNHKFIRASILYFQVRSSNQNLIELSRTFQKLSEKKPLIINSVNTNLNLIGNYSFYCDINQMIKVIFIGILLKKVVEIEYKKKNQTKKGC